MTKIAFIRSVTTTLNSNKLIQKYKSLNFMMLMLLADIFMKAFPVNCNYLLIKNRIVYFYDWVRRTEIWYLKIKYTILYPS